MTNGRLISFTDGSVPRRHRVQVPVVRPAVTDCRRAPRRVRVRDPDPQAGASEHEGERHADAAGADNRDRPFPAPAHAPAAPTVMPPHT